MGTLADWISARRSLALTFALLALSALAFLVNAGLVSIFVGEATRVFAYATVMLGVGSMLGNALGGLLRDWTQSFTAIYAVALVLCLLLLGLTLSLPKSTHQGP
jgi:predicted MFS family arabinose efflux permease